MHAKVLAQNGKWYSVNDLDLREIPFNEVVDRYTSSAVFEVESIPVVVSNVRESPDERALHMLIVATNELKRVIVSNNWLYASEENSQKRKDFSQVQAKLYSIGQVIQLAKLSKMKGLPIQADLSQKIQQSLTDIQDVVRLASAL